MPELSYREAVRDALSTAMREDEDVFIMGEDIAEMGGSMGVTHGMLEEFGPERVRNTPISEMALAGAAIGAAVQGMRPVAEIMYEDFMTLAAEHDPITNLRERLGLGDDEFEQLDAEAHKIVDEALEFAQNGTEHSPEDALLNVYA